MIDTVYSKIKTHTRGVLSLLLILLLLLLLFVLMILVRSFLCISIMFTDLEYILIIATLILSPNTFLTYIISGSHENPVKRDERSNRVVRFEGSYTVLDCE